jgi:CubicO group peptidase (beta-lactamase class C family)
MLFWTQDQRDRGFRSIDRTYVVRSIPAGEKPYPLPAGPELSFSFDIDAHMERQRNAGLIVIHDGAVRFERYGMNFAPDQRWTSFSVAKSITSCLVGAAVKDGSIGSIDDHVCEYLPDLAGPAYDDVTIRHLLTMTTGAEWDEEYTNPNADVARFWAQTPEPGVDLTVSYMRRLKKAAPAGSTWLYNTGETNLLGVLVSTVTGTTISDYLSRKIWSPFGMERDACWILGAGGHEVSGCCISASLRDFARFGQFIVDGGVVDGQSILPEDWIDQATTHQADIAEPGRGYGFQWWTNDDGSFDARGIFGQGIFIDRRQRLVIASCGNWPNAIEPESLGPERQQFYRDVRKLVAG